MLGNALRNRKGKREKGPLLAELKIRHNVACLEEGEKAGSHSVDFLLRKINLFEGNTRYLDICHPKRKWRQSYLEIKNHCLSLLFKNYAQGCDTQMPLWRANWFFWPYTYKKCREMIWVDKMRYYCTAEPIWPQKKDAIKTCAGTQLELEIVMLSETYQPHKHKCCVFSLVCGS